MKGQSKNFNKPDETRTPKNATVEVIKVGGKPVMRATFLPGWKWSKDIQPVAGCESCQMHHFGYQTSGTMHVEFDDGSTMDTHAGDVADIPPGHDAWVVGSEPAVLLDFGDVGGYAKKS